MFTLNEEYGFSLFHNCIIDFFSFFHSNVTCHFRYYFKWVENIVTKCIDERHNERIFSCFFSENIILEFEYSVR